MSRHVPNLNVDYGNMIHFTVSASASEGRMGWLSVSGDMSEAEASKMNHIFIIYI